jgi:predicted TPR repeat methyltransferase
MEDRIDYFERMLADNPDNPTGLLALANEYEKAGRDEDEAAVLERYLAVHVDDEGNAYARLGSVRRVTPMRRGSPSPRNTATAGWQTISDSHLYS